MGAIGSWSGLDRALTAIGAGLIEAPEHNPEALLAHDLETPGTVPHGRMPP